jgi:hypothetical protein
MIRYGGCPAACRGRSWAGCHGRLRPCCFNDMIYRHGQSGQAARLPQPRRRRVAARRSGARALLLRLNFSARPCNAFRRHRGTYPPPFCGFSGGIERPRARFSGRRAWSRRPARDVVRLAPHATIPEPDGKRPVRSVTCRRNFLRAQPPIRPRNQPVSLHCANRSSYGIPVFGTSEGVTVLLDGRVSVPWPLAAMLLPRYDTSPWTVRPWP